MADDPMRPTFAADGTVHVPAFYTGGAGTDIVTRRAQINGYMAPQIEALKAAFPVDIVATAIGGVEDVAKVFRAQLPLHRQGPGHPWMEDHREAPRDRVDKHVERLALDRQRPTHVRFRQAALALEKSLA